MIETISPLHAINEKELELRRRVEAAQRQAEARLRTAHEEAKNTLIEAERAGRAEAEVIFQRGLDEARQQAEAIVAAAHTEAAALRAQATAKLDTVAEQITTWVLPGLKSN